MHRRSVADAHPRARISSSSSSIASAVLWVSVGAWLATAYGERAVRAVERELRDVWTTLTSTSTTRANAADASTWRQRDEETSALGREISRVNSVTTRVTMPRLLASLRRTLKRADDTVEDRLTRTCVTLAGASALELFTRTMMNLVGRRAFLDAEARRGRDTLDDASRRVFLELTSRFVETGVLELRAIVRAIVVRELRAFVDGRDGDGLGGGTKTEWTRGDAEEFMRQCRETLNKALLVPSDVFSDARALPFEKKRSFTRQGAEVVPFVGIHVASAEKSKFRRSASSGEAHGCSRGGGARAANFKFKRRVQRVSARRAFAALCRRDG